MEKITPLLSIIVPVYNVEAYLSRCIDSVLSQTFTDFELILVDDGSPDRSGEICDEYSKKDDRIIVIHKQNGGAWSARNMGLDCAVGNYIMFIDPDDELGTIDTIEKNLNILKKYEGNSFIQYPTLWNYGNINNKILNCSKKFYNSKNTIFQAFFNLHITSVVWDKIYTSKIFSDVRFPNMKYYEDFYCVIDILKITDNVIFSDQGFYDYCIREGSAMTSDLSAKKLEDFLCVRMFALDEAKKWKGTWRYRVHFFLEMEDKLICGKNFVDYPTFELYCCHVSKYTPEYTALIFYMFNKNFKKGFKGLLIKILGIKFFIRHFIKRS